MAEQSKIQKRVGEEARSLLTEEYRILVKVKLPTTYFVKLRHRFNHNCISIVGNYNTSTIRLFKNGKLIKEEKIS